MTKWLFLRQWPLLLLLLLLTTTPTASGSDQSRGQYFIREPEDVTANLGDTVVFACHVGGTGTVGLRQWTRNGFGLGTEASLPGFPRYSLTADNSLQIEPVAEADAGDYQCQVGGTDTSPPMRSRSARLTVQVPPGPPQILHDDTKDTDDDSGDVVISVKDGETAILECESMGGRPAASLNWWQDEVGRSVQQLEEVKTRTVKYWENDTAVDNNSLRTVSVLRLRVSRTNHHNRLILCAASNVASSSSMVTRVRLSVLSVPRVELGISSGVGPLREGGSVTLHCQAVEGHPPAHAYAWYRDGRLLVGETREFFALPRLDRSHHNVVIGCEASNAVGTSSTRAVKQLSLQYGPVIMQQPEAMLVGREGETLQLSCRADSNPPARYTWTKESVGDESTSTGEQEKNAPIGFASTLPLVVNRHTVGLYRCQALVESWPPSVSRPARVGVLERPRIEAGSGETVVVYGALGEDVELTCRIRSLSRDLNITWDYKGGTFL